MGDIVHSLPVLNSLYHAFPEAEIHWLISKGFEGLLQGHSMIKKLIIINKDLWKRISLINKTFGELKSLSKSLREESYDVAIDLQGLLRSGILTAMTGAPLKIGFSDAREGSYYFYNKKIEGGKEVHAIERYLKIARAIIGSDIKEIHFPLPPIKASNYVKEIVATLGNYNILIPGARWQSKRWQTDKFAELARLLENKSILIGTKADSKDASIIKDLAFDKVIDMTGRTDLIDLIYLISNARIVFTNDTGPMHIASALDKPLVAVFGPTNPVRTGPFGKNHKIIQAKIDCSPCYKKTCSKMTCMNIISVNQVFEAKDDLRL